jgi:hypothetical protein
MAMEQTNQNSMMGGAAIEAAAGRLLLCGTEYRLPDAIQWEKPPQFPDNTFENAALAGSTTEPGTYLILVRWYPGYMSAPHTYATDRICVVISGTWWINCGEAFEPNNCIPVPAGSFVRRTARTPHYDGVIAGAKEPAVVAICGLASIDMRLVDPSLPILRKI